MKLPTVSGIFFAICIVFGFFMGQSPEERWLIFPFYATFVIGSLWFWILSVATVILLFLTLDDDRWDLGGYIVLGFLATLLTFGNFNVITYLRDNPVAILVGIISYLGIGAIWATIKILVYLQEKKTEYLSARSDFLIRNGVDANSPIPEELKEEWLFVSNGFDYKYCKSGYKDMEATWNKNVELLKSIDSYKLYQYSKSNVNYYGDYRYDEVRQIVDKFRRPTEKILISKPIISNYRDKLISWVELWPISVIYTLLNDFFRKLAKFIYNNLICFWQNLSDRMFRDIRRDF